MINKSATIYLGTPLLQSETGVNNLNNAYIIHGKILSSEPGGIIVGVKSIENDKEIDDKPGVNNIFLPLHKIDHIELG